MNILNLQFVGPYRVGYLPKLKGIYIVTNGLKWLDVGSSEDLSQRVKTSHERYAKWLLAGAFLPLKVYCFFGSGPFLLFNEKRLREYLQPLCGER